MCQIVTVSAPEENSKLSGQRPLSAACFVCMPGVFVIVAETSDGNTTHMWSQAWIVHHSALAIHGLATGSMVSGPSFCA